jgi:hypothetical protein
MTKKPSPEKTWQRLGQEHHILSREGIMQEAYDTQRLMQGLIEPGTPDRETKCCRSLWAASLFQALKDYLDPCKAAYKDEAEEWLFSDDVEITSFFWVCDHLDLKPTAVRECLTLADNNKRARARFLIALKRRETVKNNALAVSGKY